MLESEYLSVAMHNHDFVVIEPLDGKNWEKYLQVGVSILDKHKLDWQLGGGTLLGMIREIDGYIHHDTDLDVEVFIGSKRPDKLIDKLIADYEKLGFVVIRTQIYKDDFMQLCFIHPADNVIFDIYFYYLYPHMGYLNVNEHGMLFRPVWSVKMMDVVRHKNISYNIPEQVDTYLTLRYGEDWKTPSNKHESFEKHAGSALVVL